MNSSTICGKPKLIDNLINKVKEKILCWHKTGTKSRIKSVGKKSLDQQSDQQSEGENSLLHKTGTKSPVKSVGKKSLDQQSDQQSEREKKFCAQQEKLLQWSLRLIAMRQNHTASEKLVGKKKSVIENKNLKRCRSEEIYSGMVASGGQPSSNNNILSLQF